MARKNVVQTDWNGLFDPVVETLEALVLLSIVPFGCECGLYRSALLVAYARPDGLVWPVVLAVSNQGNGV